MDKHTKLPQRGDFYTFPGDEPNEVLDIFIVGECQKEEGDKYAIVRKSCGVRHSFNLLDPYEIFTDDGEEVCDTSHIRPSTLEEVEFFHKTLASKGYRWNMDKFELKRIVPKPELGQSYHWIKSICFNEHNPKFGVELGVWNGVLADDARYKNGVAFEKRSEALVVASKLTDAVNEILKEYQP